MPDQYLKNNFGRETTQLDTVPVPKVRECDLDIDFPFATAFIARDREGTCCIEVARKYCNL